MTVSKTVVLGSTPNGRAKIWMFHFFVVYLYQITTRMTKVKIMEQVLAYLFVFWLGAKMVILTNKTELTHYDWVSLAINIIFTAYFVYQAQKDDSYKQIL
jgi:hypothetical protein